MGVEDLTRGDQGVPAAKRRKWALQTIDSAPFQFWVVIVAGIGFLTDAFDLFSLQVVTPMIGFVYWNKNTSDEGVSKIPKDLATAMMCATLVGTMIGQVAFGFAADILGRRKMYGMELVIVIVGTMLMIMSSNGENNSMVVGGWLIAWRFVMGLGIGADYPLSAVITSEFAPRKYRARMLSSVFFAQPIGQLLANVLSLGAVEAFQSRINVPGQSCGDNESCVRAVDRLWRIVVGVGIVPAAIALIFRFTIPESPRYKLDILQNVHSTFEDMRDFYGAPELDAEGGELEVMSVSPTVRQQASRRSSSSSEIAPDDVIDNDSDDENIEPRHHRQISRVAVPSMHLPPGDPNFVPPLASWEDAKKYFIEEGNWRYLLGTSLSWLFLDFAFYGLGMSSPDIIRHIWSDPTGNNTSVYRYLHENSKHSLIMVSLGATIGGAAMIKAIKHVSPRVIQLWGFVVLFVLFLVTGSAWKRLLGDSDTRTGLIVLYVLCQIAFNLGPNVTTFIIPAEIFPTRYRCTCHGIAAAAGKLGSWLAQIFLAYAFKSKDAKNQENNEKQLFGYVLIVMSIFMLAGALTTYWLVPETRDHDNKSRTLEVLAGGKVVLEKLNKQRETEVD